MTTAECFPPDLVDAELRPPTTRKQPIRVRTIGKPAGADLQPLAALLLQLDQRMLKLVSSNPAPSK